MKRAKIISIVCIITALFFLSPLATAVITPQATIRTMKEDVFASEPVRAYIGGVYVERYMSQEDMQGLINMGEAGKQDFLTIYDKTKSAEEVAQAFENIQPFFQALIEYKLTGKTIDELNDMFHDIRDKIRLPRNPKWYYHGGDGGAQPAGMWNGVPTPIFGNMGAGLFNVGASALGFTLGTHTVLPTIGADLLTTWADTGETISIGGAGFTTSTGPEFGLIIGFVGIMLALPIMIVGFIFQVGFVGGYLGIGIMPI